MPPEISAGDVGTHGSDITFDKLADAANFDATERWHHLEHDEDAPWLAREVAELDVTFGDDDLECSLPPTKPNRGDVRAAILSVRRQHRGRGSFDERANTLKPVAGHPSNLPAVLRTTEAGREFAAPRLERIRLEPASRLARD
jgi:hypothetical protein